MNKKLIALILAFSLVFISETAVFAEGEKAGGLSDTEAAGMTASADEFWFVEKAKETEDSVTLRWTPKDEAAQLPDDLSFEILSGEDSIIKLILKNDEKTSELEEGFDEYTITADEITGVDWFSYTIEDIGNLPDSVLTVKTIKSDDEKEAEIGTIDLDSDTELTEKNEEDAPNPDKTNLKVKRTIPGSEAAVPAKIETVSFYKGSITPVSAKLKWKVSNETGEEVYDVFVDNIKKTNAPLSKRSFTVDGLKAGKKYLITVKMKANREAKEYISEKNVSLETAIFNIKTETRTSNSVTFALSATKKYKSGLYYIYYRDKNKKKVYVARKITIPDNSTKKIVTIKKLKTGKTYEFFIWDKTSGVTRKKTVNIPLADVSGFKVRSTHNGVILMWNKVPSATGYTITWSGDGKSGKKTVKKNVHNVYFETPNKNKKYTFSIKATRKGSTSSLHAASRKGEAVRTMFYSVRFDTDRYLYSHDGYSVGAYFPAGTWIAATGYTQGKYMFWYNGRPYQVMRASMSGADVLTSDVGRTYTKAEAESFVNKRGLYSNTNYLIWVNTYTQKEYIFYGDKGQWKCIGEAWLVSTGAPSSPTASGLSRIVQKDPQEHDSYYWSVTNGGYSLHSKPPSQGQPLGWPYSGSCVRNTFDNAKWIYYNCHEGTSVYVF